MSLTEAMEKFHEQWTSTDPACQACGRPAFWEVFPARARLAITRAPRMLCQHCLSGVDPVQIPVYSDTPRENPNRRYPFDSWMHERLASGGLRWRDRWPGYDVFLGVESAGHLWTARQFIVTPALEHPEVITSVIDGLCRLAFEQISAGPDGAKPAGG